MIAIQNGRLITPEKILEDKVLLIDRDRIHGFADDAGAASHVIDARGRCVLPGIIDIHSDKIEQFIQPRPTAQMDFAFAFKVCERDLLSAGVTTMYHSISLLENGVFGSSPLRTKENVLQIADLVANIHLRGHLIHHRVHLRIEIDNPEAFGVARGLAAQGRVHQISFMDHTPGQGQYRDLAVYRSAVAKYNNKKAIDVDMDAMVARHKNKPLLSFAQLRALTDLAHENGIAVASHDDDSEEKLVVNQEIGVDISEFPVTLEIAKAAKALGFYTVVGAPNILRGGSHSGNMSAADAVLAGCADILCSDYYPAAILHSIFLMHTKYGVSLPEMVAKATLRPARAMKIDGAYGSLEAGKKADILIVDVLDGYPVLTHALVDGAIRFRIEYRR